MANFATAQQSKHNHVAFHFAISPEILAGLASDSGELGPVPGSDNRSSASEPEIPISTSCDSCCHRPSVPRTTEAADCCCNYAEPPRSSPAGNAIAMSPSSPAASEPKPSMWVEHAVVNLEQSSKGVVRNSSPTRDVVFVTVTSKS